MSTRSGRAYKVEVREMSIEEREGGQPPDSMSDLVRLLLEDRMRRDEEASQREKDRREEMDLLRSLVESSRPTTLSAGGAGEEGAARTVPAQENVVLAKFAEGDDVDVFLTTFERVMNGYKIPEGRWAIQLAPQLSGKAQQAYASLSAEAAANYQEVKKAILRRYDVCDETYRQRFLSARKREQETYTGLANRLGDLASKWLAQCDSVPSVICRKEGHLAASCPEKHQSQPLGRPNRLDPRKCFNCQERGHIALHCPKPRSNPNLYCERVGGRTQGGREVVGQGALGGVAAGTGSGFNRCEEERYEVQGGMLVGRGDPREGEPMSTVVCAGCTVGMECRSLIHNPEGVRRTGRVEGVLVDDIILDTGCSQTMVHKHLVPKAKLVAKATTSLRCAHGDVVVYPHAEVRVEVDGIVIDVRAAVSERLPTSMILGTDYSATTSESTYGWGGLCTDLGPGTPTGRGRARGPAQGGRVADTSKPLRPRRGGRSGPGARDR